jgi:hypothetical protein
VQVRHTDHRDTKKAGHRCPAFSGWDFSLGLNRKRIFRQDDPPTKRQLWRDGAATGELRDVGGNTKHEMLMEL